jgi:hypothetical protein
MPKSKTVSMSNWEQHALSPNQIKYAALDVFVAGVVFRCGLQLVTLNRVHNHTITLFMSVRSCNCDAASYVWQLSNYECVAW